MADAAGTLLWGLWVTLCITIAAWVLWRLPVSGGGTAAPATDGSRAAWWLAFIGAVGALSTGLEAAFGAVFDLAWSQLQARISPGLALEGWASLLEPLLVLVVSLAPLLYLRHPSWRWLDRVTGRAWTTAGRVLAALTLGAWLGWPVTAVARLVGFWTPAAWPFVGAALLALAVAAAWLYRPGVAPPVE